MNVRALEQQTDRKCVPYSNRLTGCVGLKQQNRRMCGAYSNASGGCGDLIETY